MDSLSVARQSAFLGLMPPEPVKNVLASTSVSPLLPVKGGSVRLTEAALLRALFYEAVQFLLRSMSYLVGYEAAIAKDQFSWGAVTLYYANYYCVLAMNRLAGEAVSTRQIGGTYQIRLEYPPSLFAIKCIEINNHKEVWMANARLYETFNWRDASLDGTIVRVPKAHHNDHPERKAREEINYHPQSYKEIMAGSGTHRHMKNICGKYYSIAPDILAALPIGDTFEKQIAMFECHAVARQMLLLTVLGHAFDELKSHPASRYWVYDTIRQFSRNYLTHLPFKFKLKTLYQEKFDKFNL